MNPSDDEVRSSRSHIVSVMKTCGFARLLLGSGPLHISAVAIVIAPVHSNI